MLNIAGPNNHASFFSAACLSRHKDKFDPNQFKMAMQKFFIESGDRNGGKKKRKKRKEERMLKESNTANSRKGVTFESSSEGVVSSGSESEHIGSQLKSTKQLIMLSSSSSSSQSE